MYYYLLPRHNSPSLTQPLFLSKLKAFLKLKPTIYFFYILLLSLPQQALKCFLPCWHNSTHATSYPSEYWPVSHKHDNVNQTALYLLKILFLFVKNAINKKNNITFYISYFIPYAWHCHFLCIYKQGTAQLNWGIQSTCTLMTLTHILTTCLAVVQ